MAEYTRAQHDSKEDPEEQQQQQHQEEEAEEEEGEGEEGEQEQNETLEAALSYAVSAEAEANGTAAAQEKEEVEDENVEKLQEPFTKDHLVALIKKGVSKHPDLIEIVWELADVDPAHRKIFIHSLGWDTTAETLTSIFGKYGKIEDCKAVTDRVSSKSKGYAFILFKQPQK